VAKALATRSIDLDSIDRLEEKVKLLVGLVERLRSSEGRLSDENARLVRELDTTLARLTASEGSGAEIVALREEREIIKARVEDMLAQIESLNL
jgi:regulator of replication initiation timing